MKSTLSLVAALSLTLPMAAQESLSQSGGELLGGQVVYDLAGTPGRSFVLVPSTGTGPVPLPGGFTLTVGLDLLDAATAGALSGVSGTAQVTYLLPNDSNLIGLVLYAQYVTLGGPTPPIDDLSNRTSFAATQSGVAVNTVGSALTARQGHTLTGLDDGSALVAGGDEPDTLGNLTPRDTLERFDPDTQTFSASAATMSHPRSTHTATKLLDGRVLLIGGYDATNTVRATVDLYDPASDTLAAVASMSSARSQHTATLLANGRVLVVGGSSKFDLSDVLGSLAQSQKSAEIYDAAANTWTSVPDVPISEDGLVGHSASLLGNAQVLVAGGVVVDVIFGIPIPSFSNDAWRFDPSSGVWVGTDSMFAERVYHGQISLPDGRALVVGGADGDFILSSFFTLSGVEVYDPSLDDWSSVSGLNDARAYPNLVDTGSSIAVVGGLLDVNVTTGSGTPEQTIETVPYTLSGFSAGGEMLLAREVARAAALDGGLRVLIVGVGDNGISAVDKTAETYGL